MYINVIIINNNLAIHTNKPVLQFFYHYCIIAGWENSHIHFFLHKFENNSKALKFYFILMEFVRNSIAHQPDTKIKACKYLEITVLMAIIWLDVYMSHTIWQQKLFSE